MSSSALQPVAHHPLAVGPWAHSTYRIRRPFWSIFGRRFLVFAPDGSLVLFVKHPYFKFKPEFTLFTDETESVPVMIVRSRTVLAINRAYDVFDAQTQAKLGTIRSRGLKSIVRDTWDLLDANDQPVGLVQEDGLSILRRIFPILLGRWHAELGGSPVATIQQLFRLFIKEYTIDVSMAQGRIDPRFVIAIAMLALLAESAREAAS